MHAPVVQRTGTAPGHSSEERPHLAGQHGLRANAAEGEHGEAAVLELLQLHCARLSLVLGEEVLAQEEVASLAVDLALEALKAEPSAVDLVGRDGRQEGAHEAIIHHGIVRLDRRDVLEHLAGEADPEVGRHPARGREHADAPVLQLRLAEEGHELGVLGEADRVELVGAPGALGAHEALSELSVVEEADARVLVGDGKLAAAGAARHTGLGRTALPAERRHANGCRGDRGRGCHASGLCGARRGQLLCRRHTKRWCRLDAVARGARHEGAAQRVHRRAARGKRHLGAHHGCRRGLAGGAPLGAVWEP
mmetsp:Transcript_22709/g.61953  ORF Transcript_22709/g.61953 Transcript_22709/m.61953 type:complete len:308 (-) Transcript_22709:2-925(-)